MLKIGNISYRMLFMRKVLEVIGNQKIILLFSFVVLLSGCERVWFFTITDIADQSHPVFCISRYKHCEGKGIGFSYFEISEVDMNGKMLKAVWSIQPIENKTISKLTYGTTPQGYKEIKKANPLELNKIYSVNGMYFFKMVLSGNTVKAEVYNLSEFRALPKHS